MEENKIQKGDWVVCVDSSDGARLTYGKEYRVVKGGMWKGITTVIDDNKVKSRWFTFRFQKVRSRVIDTKEMIDADTNN